MSNKHKAIDNEKDLKTRKEEVLSRELEEERDFLEVMSTPRGRRFVWNFLQKTGMFNSKFIEKSLLMYWFAGRRDLGLEYYDKLTTTGSELLELFWKMQEENVEKSTTNEVKNG